MDKSWMQKGRCHPDYFRGCDEFLNFAWSRRTPDLGENIFCPCKRCNNMNSLSRDLVRNHILDYGINRSYTRWTKHGESQDVNTIHKEVINVIGVDDMHGKSKDLFRETSFLAKDGEIPEQPNTNGSNQHDHVADEPNEDQKFFKSLKEAEAPLYPGCTTTSKLSFILSMLHLKRSNGLSNKHFDDFLALLKRTYPESSIPENYNEAEKQLRDLGLECIKIDACPKVGKLQPISDEVFANVVPTGRQKRARTERNHLTCPSFERNEDIELRRAKQKEDIER